MVNKKEMDEALKVCKDEYEYFKKRYNEEKDQETKDGLGFCVMLASAGIEEYTAQLENLSSKQNENDLKDGGT